MPVPVTLVISAVTALLRYRGRVDTILSLNETARGLPFRLPPAPTVVDRTRFFEPMWKFYHSVAGRAILEAQGLSGTFKEVVDAVENRTDPLPEAPLNLCYHLYFEAADIPAHMLADEGASEQELREVASTGPNIEMRLAYYVVESHRLSRNPVFVRLALATVDTALEFFGENASTFIANPKTRGVVESLLTEFAVKQDFDDFTIEQIYQSLLGSTLYAVLDNPDAVPNEPGLKALFGALSELRDAYRENLVGGSKEKADEFFARLITAEGFKDLVSGVLRQVAKDPGFITANEDAKEVIKATLNEFADNFPEILDGDKKAVFGVIEAGIAAGAANVDGILKKQLNGKPLVTAVAAAVAAEIGTQAQERSFFKNLATGDIFAEIYKVALGAVAANPGALAKEAKLEPFARDLVAGLAQTLSETPIKDTFTVATFRALVSQSLQTLAQHPDLVARDSAFAQKVVAAALEAAGEAVTDGLQSADVIAITDATLTAATGNLALVEMDDRFRAVLVSIGGALGQDSVAALLTPAGRRDALIASVGAVAANPKVWGDFAAADIAQPLVVGIIDGLASDPTKLLSGPLLVEAVRRSLTAAARRGAKVLDGGDAGPEQIQMVLELALTAAEDQIGASVDGENLPDYLERVLLGFLRAPFALAPGGGAEFDALVTGVIERLEAA